MELSWALSGPSLATQLLLNSTNQAETWESRNLRVSQTHSLGIMCILGNKCKIPVALGFTSLSGFFLCHLLQIPNCVKSEPAEPQSSSEGLSHRCLRPPLSCSLFFLVFLPGLDKLILDEISCVRG